MKNLWIGMCTDENLKNHIISNKGKLLSGSVSQDSIIDGLTKNNVELDSINSFRVSEYPIYSEKRIKQYNWSRTGTSKDVEVGYLNLKYIGLYFKTVSLKKAARKWAKEHKGEAPLVFVYSMHSPFMAAAKEVKKILPNSKIIQIVPDLPQYMDFNMSTLKKVLKKIDWLTIKNHMKSVDKYILYTKHMADFLNLKDGQWMVMEGTINLNDVLDSEEIKKEKAIMYSGVCDLRYGIPELLEGFSKIEDEELELWLSGSGNAVDLIKECAKADKRIKYLGFLPSRKDLLIKQQSAIALINTRMPTEAASAYCFPSKVFEYMLSGNPVLSFKIPGIPDEYFEHIVEMKEPTAQCIAESITKILNLTQEERENIGVYSKKFVLDNKNNVEQARKIYEFSEGKI